jgi:hypothetical protein
MATADGGFDDEDHRHKVKLFSVFLDSTLNGYQIMLRDYWHDGT